MNFTSNLIIDLYSILLLSCIYIHTVREAEKGLLQQRLYRRMLLVTFLMLVLDIFSRFDGNTATACVIANHAANLLTFSMNLFIPSLWLLYVYFQVFHDGKRFKRLLYNLVTVNITNVVIAVLSQRWGWLYYIDSNNTYHRGWLFWLPICITAVINLASLALIAVNHKKIETRYLVSLAFFPLLPIIGVALQVAFYGTSFMLSGCTISLLIIFLNIQNRSMNIDYLTGAYNRRGLEIHMGEQVNASGEDKTFSAIWIDLDNFKYINDTFGHNTGDQVLKTTVKLLRSCLRPTDFIARLGGDEFCVVLDLSNTTDLEAAVARIIRCIKGYNERGEKPYKLAMSMGYAVYDYRSHQKVEEFQKHIDELMYMDKQAKKKLEV